MTKRIAILLATFATLVVLGVTAWFLPRLRRAVIHDITTWDAPPGDPAPLPAATGPGLAPVPRTRVILVDGLSEEHARTLPTWSDVCTRGARLRVDVGFPSVSLPVEVELWSGLTQQQTGIVFRSDRPLIPPLDQRGIPAQVPGSVAIAEHHGYLVRSLGFSIAEPAAGATPAKDADPAAWAQRWQARAREVVASDTRLAFIHILRVDTAGHKQGANSAAYRQAATDADAMIAQLVPLAPDARWFLLSDHGHRPEGGHAGEEPYIRQVEACVAGPGISAGTTSGLVHMVDVSRAIADSTGATLDRTSRGRPFSAALAAPLADDQAIPPLPLHQGALAILALVAGLAASTWGVRRWWLAPLWFPIACASLLAIRGEPTLSMRLVYEGSGRLAAVTWLPALLVLGASVWFGLGRATLVRVLVAQLALPVAALAALLTATGAWPAVLGEEVAPVVPRYTAWLSPLMLMVSHAAGVAALALLARRVLRRSGRSAPPAPPRTEPAAAPSAPGRPPRDPS